VNLILNRPMDGPNISGMEDRLTAEKAADYRK